LNILKKIFKNKKMQVYVVLVTENEISGYKETNIANIYMFEKDAKAFVRENSIAKTYVDFFEFEIKEFTLF